MSSKKFLNYGVDYRFNDLFLGLPIIESRLRAGIASYKADSRAALLFCEAIIYAKKFTSLIQDHHVLDVLVSHENYIYYAVPSQILLKNRKEIHFINANCYVKADRLFYQFEQFRYYKKTFDRLPHSLQYEMRLQARSRIKRRLNGELKVDMDYQSLSAYHNKRFDRVIKERSKTNILLALHCFIDNPHSYEKLPYVDFYSWASDLLDELSNRSNCKIYLKVHRDAPDITKKTALELSNKYKNTVLVNEQISLHQLIEEGLTVAITGYGSIAHELPYLGIPVVSCFYNPHIAFKFTYLKDAKQSYYDAIQDSISKYVEDDARQEIEEFYVVKNILRDERIFYEKSSNEKALLICNIIKRAKKFKTYDSRLDNEYFIYNS